MRKTLFILLLPLLIGCDNNQQQPNQTKKETSMKPVIDNKKSSEKKSSTIYYHSLNAAIHKGQYEGIVEVGQLLKEGTMGLGSFEKLAYEFVMIDGKAYGIPDDGKAYKMEDSAKIAFGVVKNFKVDTTIEINERMNQKEIQSFLDDRIDNNAFIALKIKGLVSNIKYRSFHPQEEPYEPSKDVENIIFEEQNMQVDIVGFYTPENAKVLNSPVYHFHFVDKARTTGGHVLDFTFEKGVIELNYATDLKVQLPTLQSVNHINLDQSIK